MQQPLPAQHRLSIHLSDRNATALTDQIALTRHVFAAEMKQAPIRVHAVTVLPMALYLIASTYENDDVVERMLRMQRAFKRHAEGDIDWFWPVVGPVPKNGLTRLVDEFHAMPVTWGLCATPQDWPFSSIHRVAPQSAVA
ncbi:MAG: hypothetical protein AAF092_07515 [Pseudomonadota bacterium]